MLFDCTALCVSLYATFMSTWPPDTHHTFGFVRYELLAGFANGLFLVFIAISILFEAIERVYDPPHIEHTNRLLLISILVIMPTIP